MPDTTALSTIEWAKLYGREMRVRIKLNHRLEAPAATALTLYSYAKEDQNGIILIVGDELQNPMNAVYLIDIGLMVMPYYVAGETGAPGSPSRREEEPRALILHPFPTGEMVDGKLQSSSFELGPCKAYHCKVQGQVSSHG